MITIKLLKLILWNFKGIKEFTFIPNGENCAVFGDNETGKTTLYDAECWLFFDKDSQGKKEFDIKPLDKENNPIHMLESEVEGTYAISGKEMVFKKVYSEKWTKKRGSAQKELTGNTIDHFIDGVPKSKGEYQSIIQGIASEDLFKLLTSPEYFNTQLHWQDRRNILLDSCGDITDADVIASNLNLKDLGSILVSRKIEDHKKVIIAKRREINDELEKIPVRIDEVYRGLPDIGTIDEKKEQTIIDELENKIKQEKALINQIESGGAIAEKTNQMKILESEMFDIKTKHRCTVQIEIDKIEAKIRELTGKLEDVSRKGIFLQTDIEGYSKDINLYTAEMQELREHWTEKNKAEFVYTHTDNCPTCGALPENQLNFSKEKALEVFNRERADALESITAKGKKLKGEVEELEKKLAEAENKKSALKTEKDELQSKIEPLNKSLTDLTAKKEDYLNNQDHILLSAKYATIEQKIISLKNGKTAETQIIKDKITLLETEQTEAKNKLDNADRAKAGNKRIEDLRASEKRLSKEYENLERELYLIDQFTRAKVDMLEGKINRKFELARFKMFEEQVNGGINDRICETTYKGVPYSTGLNNGGRINIGLDIIRTLSEHYGVQLPVFIDNAEAITNPIKLKSQMIQMFVSEKDKALRVEIEKPALAAVA